MYAICIRYTMSLWYSHKGFNSIQNTFGTSSALMQMLFSREPPPLRQQCHIQPSFNKAFNAKQISIWSEPSFELPGFSFQLRGQHQMAQAVIRWILVSAHKKFSTVSREAMFCKCLSTNSSFHFDFIKWLWTSAPPPKVKGQTITKT